MSNRESLLPDRQNGYWRGTLEQRVRALEEDVRALSSELASMRRALYTLAFSVAGGAILFAFTVLEVMK